MSKSSLNCNCGRYISIIAVCLCVSFSLHAQQNDSDGDGLSDSFEAQIGAESYLSDTDGDGINDATEVGKNLKAPLDSDNDSVFDVLDYDDDNDGLPTFLESKKDSDKDGLLDYLDTDSDNDGVADGEEAGVLNQDKNLDGIDDAFDLDRKDAIDSNGDGIDDNVKLPDHNKDGKPDYLDANFQHQKEKRILVKKQTPKTKKIVKKEKKAAKVVKQEKVKIPIVTQKIKEKEITPPDPMIVNRYTDSDNDGLSNALEKILGTNYLKRDSDGDKVSDAIEIGFDVNSPQDSDHDGIIDALDDDDDNDGVLTKFEDINQDSTAINDDTDADGVPNYLDANDDGDAILTKNESKTADSDNDGILDYLDKNDGIKDAVNAKNQIAKKTNDMNKEPEVVVLFDGNAAELTAEDEMDLDVAEQEDVVEQTLDKTSLTMADNENDEATSQDVKVSVSKSSNNYNDHWNLF